MKVVDNAPPLNCTTEELVKLVPLTVIVRSEPPATADPGFNELMTGVEGPGGVGGGGVGKGVAGGVVVEIGLTKFPPIRNMWPSLVLKARPFWPQRIRRPALVVVLGTLNVMDP